MWKRLISLVVILCLWSSAVGRAANIIWVGEDDDENADGKVDDARWPELLTEQGYSVDVRLEYWTVLNQDKVDELNRADLVIVSRNTDSGDYDDGNEETLWESVTAPTLLLTPYLSRSNRWQWVNAETITLLAGSPAWEAVLASHPVFAGVTLDASKKVVALDGSVPSLGTYHVAASVGLGNGTLVARGPGGETAIAEWQPGVEFYADGRTATARRLLFCAGTSEGSGNPQGTYNLSAAGQMMFLNAVRYMLGKPAPANGATDVPVDTVLSWTGTGVNSTYNVYFGVSFDAVSNATAANPQGVLVGQGLSATSCAVSRLAYGTTYYWRVDETSAGGAPSKGFIWSFTAEPISYPLPGDQITATASSSSGAGTGPEKTIDGSGLNENDQHSVTPEHGWLSAMEAAPWIQYDLGKALKLDKLMVWNSNQSLESAVGFGAKNVTVEYSVDGAAWTVLGAFEFAQAPGDATYTANTTVSFGGAMVRHVKLTITSNWGGILPQCGLSEVRFLYVPVAARNPDPDPNAMDVHPQVLLSWKAGREAASHNVYLGTDQQAVADGAVAPVTVAAPSYDVALNLDTTYYWKVTEVNQAASPSAWDSDLWFFATASYVSVDDFESYTNTSPKRIFQTWIDGAGYTEPAPGVAGNGTGALVGHDPTAANFSETVRIYDGARSMPLYYDNSAAPKISEAVRTFNPPQDWSKHGITTLVLYFLGDPSNAGAPVYVKINGTKVLYNNGAPSTTSVVWKQWNIPLASVAGLNLKSINTLTIGVGDGAAAGSGLILVDAIRLYATPPAVVAPVDPGTNGLAAMYSFENNVQDSSGKNLHGTASGDPGYAGGAVGNALVFDGVNDSVNLPIGSLIGSLSNATFAVWVNYPNVGGAWQRAFDFNTSTSINMFLTPDANNNNMRFALTKTGSGGEEQLNSPQDFPAGWHHAAVTIDSATMTMLLYIDGRQVDSEVTAILPKDLGVTTNNYLGQSAYTGDAYFNGSLDELCIYNRALSEAEIRYLAGDR